MPEKKPAMRNITLYVPGLIKDNVRILINNGMEASFSEFARRAIRKLLLRELPLIDQFEYNNFKNLIENGGE